MYNTGCEFGGDKMGKKIIRELAQQEDDKECGMVYMEDHPSDGLRY